MKKYFYILAAITIAPTLGLAQSANFDAEVDQELDQMYAQRQANAPQAAAPAAPTSGRIAGTAGNGSQPIYILNQATPTSTATAQTQTQQVQKQPIAVIESSPLVESRADQMRKSRQDAEVQTEQKIVEKLEASRLEDEKRRAEALFGNRFENSQVNYNNGTQQITQPVVVQAPPPAEPKENFRDVIREELNKNSLKAELVEKTYESRYFSAIAGIGDYPDVKNVRGNYTLGAAFGTNYDQLIVEGSFLFSNYSVEQVDCCSNPYFPNIVDTDQYQGAISAKYQLMSGMVRPVVGGIAAYSYRKYTWNNNYGYGYYPGNYSYGTSTDSHAIDLGVSAGVDLQFNHKFALGLDYRYMFNLSSRTDNQAIVSGPQYGTPLEKLSYYLLSLAAKVNF